MDHTDNTPHPDQHRDDAQCSVTEHRLRRLVVPEPEAYEPSTRLDLIHDPDLNLLWGVQE